MQRGIYYGPEAVFLWRGADTLVVREYATDMPGWEHRIDVTSGSYGVEDRWGSDEHGLRLVATIVAFLPAFLVLLIGLPAAVYLPRFLTHHLTSGRRSRGV